MRRPKLNHIVGIGGSAGDLQAYRAILEALPVGTGMAFVLIAPMHPKGESCLPEILSWPTRMPVHQASEGMRIRADHVYVIPSNVELLLECEIFRVVSARPMAQGQHKQVDRFLESLASSIGQRAIGILLSGGDGDGTAGCKAIQSKGGITFAQDVSAEVDSMPREAFHSGHVDFVFSPIPIAEELVKIAAMQSAAFERLKQG